MNSTDFPATKKVDRMTTEAKQPSAPDLHNHLTATIVSAYVSNNQMPANEVPGFIRNVFAAVAALPEKGAAAATEKAASAPAVPIKKSVTPEYIVCLEDGKRLKMLKRYLRSHFDMSPEQYRAKWGLPPEYPMCAPNYAKQRSDFAKSIGLGRSAPAPEPTPTQARRRKSADGAPLN